MEALRRRFDDIFWQFKSLLILRSYENGGNVLDAMTTIFSREMLDDQIPPGRDVFRMTPLHLIALASKPNVEVPSQLV